MASTRSDTESDDSNPASSVSPTPTIRDSRNLAPIDARTTPHIPAPIQTHQVQDLGVGRPEVSQTSVASNVWVKAET